MRPYLGYASAALVAVGLYAGDAPRGWMTVYTLGIITILAATHHRSRA